MDSKWRHRVSYLVFRALCLNLLVLIIARVAVRTRKPLRAAGKLVGVVKLQANKVCSQCQVTVNAYTVNGLSSMQSAEVSCVKLQLVLSPADQW